MDVKHILYIILKHIENRIKGKPTTIMASMVLNRKTFFFYYYLIHHSSKTLNNPFAH